MADPVPLPQQIERWQIAGGGAQAMRRGEIVAAALEGTGLLLWLKCEPTAPWDRAVIVVHDGMIPPPKTRHLYTAVGQQFTLGFEGPGATMSLARHLYEIVDDG